MSDITFPSGDTAPSVLGTLTHADGQSYSVAQADTVRFQMRRAEDRRLMINELAVVVDAAAGSVRYDWQPGDLMTPGDYIMRWMVNWSDGTIQHSEPANTITIADD